MASAQAKEMMPIMARRPFLSSASWICRAEGGGEVRGGLSVTTGTGEDAALCDGQRVRRREGAGVF